MIKTSSFVESLPIGSAVKKSPIVRYSLEGMIIYDKKNISLTNQILSDSYIAL